MVEFEVYGETFHDYVADFIPFFIICMLVELIINVFFKKKKNYFGLGDSLTSMGGGLSTIVLERIVPFAIMSAIEFYGVVYIYRNYRIVDVSEYSVLAWIFCFITVDFGYYWFHRLAHEVNAFWATHVTHHSSEKYNLTTALRQNVLQIYISWIFFLPIGLFTPPGMYVFHKQFNTINQFWIHTQLIDKLPWPIEFILNTPSHHRVHHGRNPKYLDKNYGGTLIIWDRIFKTFEPEEEKVYYGLVYPLNSNDPTWIQIHKWYEMYQHTKLYTNWIDKIKVFLCGPGWQKGTGRLGDLSTLPIPTDKDEQERIPKSLSTDLNVYLFIHYMFISFFALIIRDSFENQVGATNVTLSFAFLYVSLTSFGAMFDGKWYAALLETIRLWVFIIYTLVSQASSHPIIHIFRLFYFTSSVYIIFKKIYTSNIFKSYLKSSQKILNNKLD
ncbi:hypothetical protein DICPUDRAFT_51289 [Dictyostelium purpureum]|uniref:Fatty acid hydroxylase domain-containing protein n=1 Tax=Dictyostelium purpureum TaxID=5786 RepID=F1A310_DICPU|nr:uncharacterized protein DICPUDRAFT_51289 [Dictyostelium purpureum]EGC29416.1 hypothetical protein DICPUDRAFT_51289 [Dictyostelium purpureum]|eukprot:XP_003294054.1 hypothetical protein DICPUDRAFT_51289 [Dictyostelium purpureum]